MKKQRKSFIGNVLLTIIFSILAIVFAEITLRLMHPQKTMYPRYIDTNEYAIELPKNTKIVNSQGSRWKYIYNTNQLGRRGPYLPIQDKYVTTNVVVLGDSFTFGFGVNDNDIYTSILSTHLGNDYAVVNGGMGGWGIDSEIKWYYKIGTLYQPKYVVVQFTANDPYDSFTGVTKIENGEFIFYPRTYLRPAWQAFLSKSRFFQNSHLYALLRNAYDKYHTSKAAAKKQDITQEINASQSHVDPIQVNYSEMLNLFARKLQEQNKKLIFLSVTHHHKESGIYHYDLQHFPYIEQEAKRLEEKGMLHYIDLDLQEMSKHRGSPEGHQWSKVHHRLVGEDIAKMVMMLEKLDQDNL